MLQSVRKLQRFKIMASDGEVGSAETLYFDDERWTIRYFVVDTTSWRLGPRVRISPISIRQMDRQTETLLLSTTREQSTSSPPLTGGPDRTTGDPLEQPPDVATGSDDVPLRSTREVIGYHVQAADGELGHVADFLVDDRTWAIRYAVVDTSNWWFGNTVLIAAEWLDRVSRSDAKVFVDLSRQAVKEAPAYDPAMEIDRQWETDYFTHYQRHGYWQTSGMATPTLVSLKRYREFIVAGPDVDPRGWKVVSGADGRTIGEVDDLIADPLTMKVRYLDVDLEEDIRSARPDNSSHILLPAGYVRLSERDDRVTADGLSAEDIAHLPAYTTSPIPSQYDAAFRAALRDLHPDRAGGSSADDWSVARDDTSQGTR